MNADEHGLMRASEEGKGRDTDEHGFFSPHAKDAKGRMGDRRAQMNADEHGLVSGEERGEGDADERRFSRKGENKKGLADPANPFI